MAIPPTQQGIALVLDDSEYGSSAAPFIGKKDAQSITATTRVIREIRINMQLRALHSHMESGVGIFTATVEDLDTHVMQPWPITRGTVQYRIGHDIR
jgi:hypothetical protein